MNRNSIIPETVISVQPLDEEEEWEACYVTASGEILLAWGRSPWEARQALMAKVEVYIRHLARNGGWA